MKFFLLVFAWPVLSLALLVGCTAEPDVERLGHEFVDREIGTRDDSALLKGEFELLLRGLKYKKVITLPPGFDQDARERTRPFPEFVESGPSAPGRLPLHVIRFMQSSIWDEFHDSAYDIITTAYQIQRGEIPVTALPAIHVWRDSRGRVWTLDNRRVAVFLLAGNVGEVPVRWAGRDLVDARRFEYTTRTAGRSIVALLDYRLGVVIDAGAD